MDYGRGSQTAFNGDMSSNRLLKNIKTSEDPAIQGVSKGYLNLNSISTYYKDDKSLNKYKGIVNKALRQINPDVDIKHKKGILNLNGKKDVIGIRYYVSPKE